MSAGADAAWLDALADGDLAAGAQASVLLRGARVLVCRSDAGLHAVADLCPHAMQPLQGGRLRGTTLRCPRHGACFDLSTGRPVNPVTDRPLKVYPVRVVDGRIEVNVRG